MIFFPTDVIKKKQSNKIIIPRITLIFVGEGERCRVLAFEFYTGI